MNIMTNYYSDYILYGIITGSKFDFFIILYRNHLLALTKINLTKLQTYAVIHKSKSLRKIITVNNFRK